MADLFVDVDGLLELSRRLEEVKTSLQQVRQDVGQSPARLGSSRLGSALDDFVDGWKDGRRKIIEGIDGLQGRIRTAVDAYSEQEEALSSASGAGGR